MEHGQRPMYLITGETAYEGETPLKLVRTEDEVWPYVKNYSSQQTNQHYDGYAVYKVSDDGEMEPVYSFADWRQVVGESYFPKAWIKKPFPGTGMTPPFSVME